MQIYLIGFMGVGKTTVGQALAKATGRPLIDTDAEIVAAAGMSISDYFAKYGEDKFRDLEHETLEKVSQGSDAIISCGGGVAIFERNVATMHQYGKTVLLKAPAREIWRRVRFTNDRPLLAGRMNVESIQALMDARLPAYKKAADIKVSCFKRSPEEIAATIAQSLT